MLKIFKFSFGRMSFIMSVIEKRVYYHDTDAGGVVYYANYLDFLEEARTLFLEERKIACHVEFLYAVRECSIKYLCPARYGDILICDAQVSKLTAAQIFFDQKIYLKTDKKLIAEAKVVLVSLNKEFKPVIIPEPIRERILS